MPNITAPHIAKYHAERMLGHLNYETIVVSESGDVVCNMDACQEFESEGKKYFIVKGEKKETE